ncbi:phosphoethanolamine transferase [Pelomonas sp. SE-A7]|uniref:phosphoethanolamine transferase n=1 Tax=Pelomonas sp. SE-A7 TaxID=3054953 RepID=UPI00259C9542|nr:phosphoethanolamine transferase [Pelomonas sp. SE-A7]MDM4767054.1 sulfatase-like hydrolase/transferase [Pelomonas sp. SE-A7]
MAWLAPFELFYVWQFRLPSGPHVYGVIADTDWAEATAWLGPWALPLVVFAVAWAVCVALLCRWAWRAGWTWKSRSRVLVLASSTLVIAVCGLIEWASLEVEARFELEPNAYVQHSLSKPQPGLTSLVERSFPWGLPVRWFRFHEHQQALLDHGRMAASHDFGVRWRPGLPVAGRQVVVLVIGETGRPDRWGLFGAERDTTPELQKRVGLLAFSDVVSGASATREAVPLMLTRRPPENMLAPPAEASVVTAFRQAGFKTYWLSTQGAAGAHETPISVLAREADEAHFVNGIDYRGAGALDGDLLPLLAKVLAKSEERQFIVLHTLGSHLNYAHRYPPAFERFKPALGREDKPDIWRSSQATELRNAYDNSVLYTDHVLAAVIDQLSASGATASMLYAADHGETLFDGDCKQAGHGFAAEVNYRVPLVVWLSEPWQRVRQDEFQRLQQHRREPFSALSVFPTLTGLAGFDISSPHAHRDIAAGPAPGRSRLVTHFGNFDRNLAGRGCDSRTPAAGR